MVRAASEATGSVGRFVSPGLAVEANRGALSESHGLGSLLRDPRPSSRLGNPALRLIGACAGLQRRRRVEFLQVASDHAGGDARDAGNRGYAAMPRRTGFRRSEKP